MKLNLQITGLIEDSECDYSGKKGEVFVLTSDEMPELRIATGEFIKYARFEQKRVQKMKSQPTRPARDS